MMIGSDRSSTMICILFIVILSHFPFLISSHAKGSKHNHPTTLRKTFARDGNQTQSMNNHSYKVNINHLFTINDFLRPEIYQQFLPRVTILSINSSFYRTAIDYLLEERQGKKKKHSMNIHEHSHDILFYYWLVTHYEKTILMMNLPKTKKKALLPLHPNYAAAMQLGTTGAEVYSSNSLLDYHAFTANAQADSSRESNPNVVDAYFVPTAIKDIWEELPRLYWRELDNELEKLIALHYQPKVFRSKSNRTKKKKDHPPKDKGSKSHSQSTSPATTSVKSKNSDAELDENINPIAIDPKDDNATDNVDFDSELERIRYNQRVSQIQTMRTPAMATQRRSLTSNHDSSNNKEDIPSHSSRQLRVEDHPAVKQFIVDFIQPSTNDSTTPSSSSSLPSGISPTTLLQLFFPNQSEKELLSRSLPLETFYFQIEHTFLAATYLDQTKSLQHLYHFIRNIRDLHFLRVDNELTTNGRDLFVPYHTSRLRYQMLTNINVTISLNPKFHSQRFQNTIHPTINHYQLYKRRKYFFMAACREPPGHGENTRKFRTGLYEQLSQSNYCRGNPQQNSESICYISKKMTNYQFDYAMFNADFCFILPGDTSSTSKLYKAIYANCIPVIFVSYPSQLPFAHFLHWSKFAIVVSKDLLRHSGKLKQFLTKLLALRNNLLALNTLKKNVFLVSEFFDYEKYDFPSVYHLTLMELQLIIRQEQEMTFF